MHSNSEQEHLQKEALVEAPSYSSGTAPASTLEPLSSTILPCSSSSTSAAATATAVVISSHPTSTSGIITDALAGDNGCGSAGLSGVALEDTYYTDKQNPNNTIKEVCYGHKGDATQYSSIFDRWFILCDELEAEFDTQRIHSWAHLSTLPNTGDNQYDMIVYVREPGEEIRKVSIKFDGDRYTSLDRFIQALKKRAGVTNITTSTKSWHLRTLRGDAIRSRTDLLNNPNQTFALYLSEVESLPSLARSESNRREDKRSNKHGKRRRRRRSLTSSDTTSSRLPPIHRTYSDSRINRHRSKSRKHRSRRRKKSKDNYSKAKPRKYHSVDYSSRSSQKHTSSQDYSKISGTTYQRANSEDLYIYPNRRRATKISRHRSPRHGSHRHHRVRSASDGGSHRKHRVHSDSGGRSHRKHHVRSNSDGGHRSKSKKHGHSRHRRKRRSLDDKESSKSHKRHRSSPRRNHTQRNSSGTNEGIVSKSEWIMRVDDRTYIMDKFRFERVLGDGNFAVVHRCVNRKTKEAVAMKEIDKHKVSGKKAHIENEVELLARCRHPNIIRLISAYQTDDYYYVALELLEYGDLFEAIKVSSRFSEPVSAGIVQDIAGALQYLHTRDIVHRDIKPENLLLTADFRSKLADFGLACKVMGPLYRVCGTPTYVAPEILAQIGYEVEVDIWSLGIITYIMLCGYAPFRHPDRVKLFRKIKEGIVEFETKSWHHVSEDAIRFVEKVLVVDAKDRLTASEILQNRWVRQKKSD